MAKAAWRISSQGDRCLMVEFGQKVDRETNLRARALAQYLVDHPLPGVLDVVPAFTSVAIHYRPEVLVEPAGDGLPYDRLAERVEQVLQTGVERKAPAQRRVEIPVCYGGDFGPDLEEIARARKVTPDELITIHSQSPHVVYMLGFAPGFPYIAGLDERLAMPRRATPRLKIPLGTIAAVLTGLVVYLLVAMKLTAAADPESLAHDPLVMARIAVWPPIILIGLACATLSSALGWGYLDELHQAWVPGRDSSIADVGADAFLHV